MNPSPEMATGQAMSTRMVASPSVGPSHVEALEFERPGYPFRDLRGFIDLVDQMGELRRFDGVEWDLEIGAITELFARKHGPALLFDNIPGYPSGFRVMSHAFGNLTRSALALQLPMGLSGLEMLKEWRYRNSSWRPIPPVEVRDGPILENVVMGDDVNLYMFPTPRWHELDGGRFIGTGNSVIVQDPDPPEAGWVNLGSHRAMIHDERHCSVGLIPGRHGQMMADKWHARGMACPIAMSVGQDPTLWMATCYPLPYGQSEYDFTGWLRGEPTPVVKGPTTGLPIPANAEIVIEGELLPPSENRAEGLFGEWAGYYAAGRRKRPLMRVTAILHRNDPILFGAMPIKPPAFFYVALPLNAAAIWDQLEAAGIIGIKGVWQLVFSWGPLILVVAVEQKYAGHAKQVAMAAGSCQAGAFQGKLVIVVDDDIDITDPEEVLWAVATRCDVRTGVDVVNGLWTGTSDAALPDSIRLSGHAISSRLLIDACRPFATRHDFPAVNVCSRELLERMARKWGVEL